MNNDHILSWAHWLAREIGGKVELDDGDVQIKSSSEKWEKFLGDQESFVLSASPVSMEAWRTRIKYAEKMAAQAILAGPIGYSCIFGETTNENSIDVLRLAFGLSLSTGKSCRQRFTAYYVFGQDETYYINGSDKLFESSLKTAPLEVRDKKIKHGIENLFTFIPKIEEAYINSHDVQARLAKLNDAFTVELRDLDRFYSPSYEQKYIDILGNAPEGVRGNDTLEVEYSNRMEDIFEKYKISVLFEPLSVGLITCVATVSNKDIDLIHSLPFIQD